jgi:hypothetical protein
MLTFYKADVYNCSELSYNDTVKPVKLATLVSQLPITVGHTFTEPENSYDIMHGHYSISQPPV